MKLTEFLLARIAEDERLAELTPMAPRRGHPTDTYVGSRWMNFRTTVLAECEAKRRIVEAHGSAHGYAASSPMPHRSAADFAEGTLRLLAMPYADHPDFQPEWRIEETP